jgi:ribose 5-phosphate isomerase B
MRIALGSDHAGLTLRQSIGKVVLGLGHQIHDLGTHGQDAASYVDFAQSVARQVQQGKCQFGILVCGTGLGMSMAANKFQNIRAALCCHEFSAQMARAHNDANILCLGERLVGAGLAESIVKTFLNTPFAGGRHQARLDQLAAITEVT